MPRYKLGQAPADASIRNGKYRKTVDIPVEYLDALNALAKADNRDLKNYFETEIIKLAVGYIEANGKPTGPPIQNNGIPDSHIILTGKEDAGKNKAKSSFLDGRRKQKGISS